MNEMFIRTAKIDWNKIEKDSYLRKIEAINGVEEISFDTPITFFVGENGSGKSTLLEAIAVAYGFNPEGGPKSYCFSTYDSHSELYDAIKLIKGYRMAKTGYFLRAESFYNVATAELAYYEDDRDDAADYHSKSHGESFMSIAQGFLHPNGIFMFDEPEAALSPQRQLTLAKRLSLLHRYLIDSEFSSSVVSFDIVSSIKGSSPKGETIGLHE